MRVRGNGYCSAKERGTAADRPLSEEQLCVDGIYDIFFALETDDPDRANARFPGRVVDIELWEGAVYTRLEILDDDFKRQSGGWAVFRADQPVLLGGLAIAGQPVTNICFERPYDNFGEVVIEKFLHYRSMKQAAA